MANCTYGNVYLYATQEEIKKYLDTHYSYEGDPFDDKTIFTFKSQEQYGGRGQLELMTQRAENKWELFIDFAWEFTSVIESLYDSGITFALSGEGDDWFEGRHNIGGELIDISYYFDEVSEWMDLPDNHDELREDDFNYDEEFCEKRQDMFYENFWEKIHEAEVKHFGRKI